MKAFVLTLRLRMVRTAVADANTEMQQPNRQRREPMQEAISPRRRCLHPSALAQKEQMLREIR
jgi:hypothetical protein